MVCLFGVFPGSWGNIPLDEKTTRDTQIVAENILYFPVIFCNKKSHFLTRLIRTVFTIHTYLFPTSDFNEILNNMLC